ncbi:MAG TPA: SOS response-associated peptidase family protein, partial [Phycisphaerales bacterium]|nr:SOS response-associated peptidase family protein [Phycisphaerales bacterium]
PVILDASDVNRWLDPAMDGKPELQNLMKPAPDSWFTMHPVSRRVNTPKVDEASLIEQVDEEIASEPPSKVKPPKGKNANGDGGLFG